MLSRRLGLFAIVVWVCAVVVTLAASPVAQGQTTVTPTVRQVVGGPFKYVLLSDGTVFGWGREESGGLAAREALASSNVTTPLMLNLPGRVRQMAAGSNAAYALLEDGTVIAWGMNDSGQFGRGPGSERTTDNPLRSPTPVPVSGLSGVVEVAAAGEYALAVLADGSVKGWGSGIVVGTGGGMRTIEGLADVAHVAAAGRHALALTKPGQVIGWGSNLGGQLGRPVTVDLVEVPTAISGLDRIVAVGAAGTTNFGFSVALRSDGTVWTWGSNQSATMGHGTFWGGPAGPNAVNEYPVPTMVKGITTARALAVGNGHVAVLLADKTLRLWGHDGWGQIGVGTSGFYAETPKRPMLTDVTAVFVAGNTSFAVRGDGSLYWWGFAAARGRGEMTMDRKVPTLVPRP